MVIKQHRGGVHIVLHVQTSDGIMDDHPSFHPSRKHPSTAGPGGVWRKGGIQVQLFTETGSEISTLTLLKLIPYILSLLILPIYLLWLIIKEGFQIGGGTSCGCVNDLRGKLDIYIQVAHKHAQSHGHRCLLCSFCLIWSRFTTTGWH